MAITIYKNNIKYKNSVFIFKKLKFSLDIKRE